MGSGTYMFKQKVHSQGLNGVIDKVHTLIVNQGEWVAESCKNKFVHEFYYDYCNVCPQRFGLHPLGSIIGCHQNIAITNIMTFLFNVAYEINTPFCERLNREHCDQFSQTNVDQIGHPLAIVIGSTMVHNILMKN
jgi:hypothetical protein